MSSAEDRFREADELARDLEEDNRRRAEVRAQEMKRLKRLHAAEASQDRRVAEHTRAMRVVRRLQWQREPAQVRRFMLRFTAALVVVPLVGAALVWLTVVDLVMRQGGTVWSGHGLGVGYMLAFGGALAWYTRSCWLQEPPERAPTAAVWTLLLTPVVVLTAAAGVGWLEWGYIALVLGVFLLVAGGGIYMLRETPRQVRKIESERET